MIICVSFFLFVLFMAGAGFLQDRRECRKLDATQMAELMAYTKEENAV